MGRAALFFVVCGLIACGPNLELPTDLLVVCTTSSDCPLPLTCQPVALRCIDPASSDKDPPALLSASAPDDTHVTLELSEAVLPSAGEASHYAIDPLLQIHDVALAHNLREIDLTVDAQEPGATYTVAVAGLADLLGNGMTAPSSQTFTGFGASPDTAPPDALSPAADAVTPSAGATLVWSRRLQARTYTIDVASDADFTQPISGSPFSVDDPKNSLTVTPDQPVRYYWRVRANTTQGGAYGSSTFNVTRDVVYVYCAGASCSDTGAIGNKSAPFATLRAAVHAAEASGIDTINIAGRTDGGAYAGNVTFSGLALQGGYSPDFATLDPTTNQTVVSSSNGAVLTVIGASASSSIAGLTLRSDDIGLAVQGVFVGAVSITNNDISAATTGITIADCSITDTSLVTLSSNTVHAVPNALMPTAVSISRAGSTLADNVLSTPACAASCADIYVVSIAGGSAVLTGNTIRSGAITSAGTVTVHGVYVVESSIEMRGNDLRTGPTSGSSNWGLFFAYGRPVGRSIIANNILGAGDAGPSVSANVFSAADFVIVNNVLYSSGATYSYALSLASTTKAIIANNILFTAGGTYRYCINESDSSNNITDLHDNLLTDCPAGLYYDAGGGTRTTIGEVNTASKTTQGSASTTGGNITVANRDVIGFVSFPNDLHLTAATPSSVYYGGHNTSTSTCGAGANESCGGVSIDADGRTRTCPGVAACFSIGAYELDP